MSVAFGIKLRELRVANDYSEKQMSELLDVPVETYKEFEAGGLEPSVYRMHLLTGIFNVDIFTLFEYEE